MTISERAAHPRQRLPRDLIGHTFELYDLHWGAKPEHTYWSATVFYAFRLAFDAFALGVRECALR